MELQFKAPMCKPWTLEDDRTLLCSDSLATLIPMVKREQKWIS